MSNKLLLPGPIKVVSGTSSYTLDPASPPGTGMSLTYISENNTQALGTTSSASATFVDIGNKSSTGWADYTTGSLTAGTYKFTHIIGVSGSGGAAFGAVQLLVDGSAPSQTEGRAAITSGGWGNLGGIVYVTFGSTTTHTLAVQWKNYVAGTMAVTSSSNRYILIERVA